MSITMRPKTRRIDLRERVVYPARSYDDKKFRFRLLYFFNYRMRAEDASQGGPAAG